MRYGIILTTVEDEIQFAEYPETPGAKELAKQQITKLRAIFNNPEREIINAKLIEFKVLDTIE